MFNSIKQNILLPLTTRVGTLIAGVLAPYGVAGDHAHMIAVGVIGVGLVGLDLVAAWLRRQKIVNDVLVGKAP